MHEDDLLSAIRARLQNPAKRIDLSSIRHRPLFDVAPLSAIAEAEARLGFTLPPLLVRLYTEVANGGVGPGAGTLGLTGGYDDGDGKNALDWYALLAVDARWPRHLLELWDWGCGRWSCLDCSTNNIVTVDEYGLVSTSFTLHTWLEMWVKGTDLMGEIYEMEQVTKPHPYTGKPITVRESRGAKGVRILAWQ